VAKRKSITKKAKQATDGQNGGIVSLTKELFQAAITLRGSVERLTTKRHLLPIIFLRFLSLRYDRAAFTNRELLFGVVQGASQAGGQGSNVRQITAVAFPRQLVGPWLVASGAALSGSGSASYNDAHSELPVTLAAGARLGPYEIVSALGAGGMDI